MLLYIVVKMDGEIWPGNVREGERVKAPIRPTACGRPVWCDLLGMGVRPVPVSFEYFRVL